VRVETTTGDVIESATVKLLEWDSATSAYITTSQQKTNANGDATFNIELSQHLYKFLVIKDSFQQETQANLITVTGLTTLVTLEVAATDTSFNINGFSGTLTNQTVNATHQIAFFTVTDNTGLTSEFCLNVYDVLGNIRTLISVNCTTSASAILVSLPFNINKTMATLIEGTGENSRTFAVVDTILIKEISNIEEILEEFGFIILVPFGLIIVAFGVGLMIGNIYIGTSLIIVMAWVSNQITSTYMPGKIAGVITIICLLIMWGSYKK